MHTYPLVNWWRGNLRQHESYLSLVVRFAYLNGIKVGQACSYLDGLLGNRTQPSDADVKRLGDALDDDVATLHSVIGQPIKLTSCPGTTLPAEEPDGSVRYCEQCAAVGYHSYLHEHRWLAHCPLHGTALKVMWPSTRAGSAFVRTGNALAQLMSAACPQWPTAKAAFRPEAFPSVGWLTEWTASAVAKANELTNDTLWSSHWAIFRDSAGYGKAIGQLHALAPVPAAMAPMFSAFEQGWTVERQGIPRDADQTIVQETLHDTNRLVRVYLHLAPDTDCGCRVDKVVRACRATLQARHLECHCRWGKESLASAGAWVPAHPEEWPLCTLTCPHAVARAELELAAGRLFDVLPNRGQLTQRAALYAEARSLATRGLVQILDDIDPGRDGAEGCGRFQWVGSPRLNVLLDAIACTEVQLVHEALTGWLDSIDAGRHPALFTAPRRGPHLCGTADALELLTWTRSPHYC